jgi:integrase
MAIYKRGDVYWFEFVWNGERIRESTKQGNRVVARQIESARRTQLAKGEVGIEERKPPPRLKEFAPKFRETIAIRKADTPLTVSFYNSKLDRLLEYEPLAAARLNQIDEALIERYVKQRRGQMIGKGKNKKQVSPASVNRELATLRRLLRLACEWRVINRVPRIQMLPGERNREFVLGHEQEHQYLDLAPQPLKDVALLVLDTGLRVGEVVALKWSDVHVEPINGARFGYLNVRSGKSKNARRNLSLTARVAHMLKARAGRTVSEWVFPGETDGAFLATSLNHQHCRLRKHLGCPSDFVIHSLRHTMLTRLGEAGVDAFTIMKIAGHSSVTVSQKYIHPSPEALERAFERLEILNEKLSGDAVEVPTVSTTANKSAFGGQSVNIS